jgi:hypothetical protein
MPHVFAQVEIQRITLKPEDKIVNGFHFTVSAVNTANLDLIRDRLRTFYNVAIPGGTNTIKNLLAGQLLAATGHVVKMYDMQQVTPRVPVRIDDLQLVPNGNTSYPAEVALCLSYRGSLLAGTNPRRRRGRIYLGPLSNSGIAAISSGDSRPLAAVMTYVADAGKRLMDANSATNVEWVVFSKAGQERTSVQHVWVDDAFDTQRRRGADPTTRITREQAAV